MFGEGEVAGFLGGVDDSMRALFQRGFELNAISDFV